VESVFSISIGAFLGALLRWKLGDHLNPLFPTIPMGTLAANLIGCLFMGAFIFYTTNHSFLSYEARLGIATGFLGSLTTFSTFSGEAWVLFSRHEFLWLAAHIGLHVGGAFIMVGIGYAVSKLMFQTMGG